MTRKNIIDSAKSVLTVVFCALFFLPSVLSAQQMNDQVFQKIVELFMKEAPRKYIKERKTSYKAGLQNIQEWYKKNCREQGEIDPGGGKESKPKPPPVPPKPPTIEVVSTKPISGNNPFDPTNPLGGSTVATPSVAVSSGSSTGSGGSRGGTLTSNWSSGDPPMANLILGSSSTLNTGYGSSSQDSKLLFIKGSSTYGAKPQGAYRWCDTGRTDTRNRTLGTTSTDKVRVGGTTYIVTHTATVSGVTIISITQ